MCLYGIIRYQCGRSSTVWMYCPNAPEYGSLCDDIRSGPDVYAPHSEGCEFSACQRRQCLRWHRERIASLRRTQTCKQEKRRRLRHLEDLGKHARRRDREEMERIRADLKEVKRRERQVQRSEKLNRDFLGRYYQFYNVVAQQTFDSWERHSIAVERSIQSFGLQGHVRQHSQSSQLPTPLDQYMISQSGELRSLEGCTTEPQQSQPEMTQAETAYTVATPSVTYTTTPSMTYTTTPSSDYQTTQTTYGG